mmetsp:Transcript_9283/g.56529  ORF Transcript_9283/g.56529 Transcript_9283/m.56529 type:complete len:87 (+) Transcript_9283:1157-1417(+)
MPACEFSSTTRHALTISSEDNYPTSDQSTSTKLCQPICTRMLKCVEAQHTPSIARSKNWGFKSTILFCTVLLLKVVCAEVFFGVIA